MSNFTDVSNLIKAMSGSGENVVAVNRSYLQFMGSLEGGLFLSQVIFFSDKSKRKDGYFYKTYKDWYEHTFISEYNIRKLTKKMNEMGFLETKVIKANGSPTLHYKFDMNAFVSMFMPFLKNLSLENEKFNDGNENIKVSLTETTTKTTTDIKNNISCKQDSIDYEGLVNYLNFKTNKNYKHSTKKTRDLIKARLNEGFTLQDFKTVIDKKCDEWLNDGYWNTFLRPETLFGNKFEGYLNQADIRGNQKVKKLDPWEAQLHEHYGSEQNTHDNHIGIPFDNKKLF